MSFVKSSESISKNAIMSGLVSQTTETIDFYDAEMLMVFWETKPEIIKRLLPPPLKPAKRPIALAFVANYPRTNFDVAYLEGALFLRAEFNGEEGTYCLSMPVTNDIALALGREVYGYPKKMAKIELKRNGDLITGLTERRGIRFVEISARMTGKFNADDALGILGEIMGTGGERTGIAFNFKHFPAPEGGGFDYNPRLIREEVIFRPNNILIGEAEIKLKPSEYDPWAEVEVVRMLGAVYTVGNNSMKKGKVVAEVDTIEFAPYAFIKWDFI